MYNKSPEHKLARGTGIIRMQPDSLNIRGNDVVSSDSCVSWM